MSNELNNIVSRNSNGVYEGVAIGGDRYPGSTFIDHLLRYQAGGLQSPRSCVRPHAFAGVRGVQDDPEVKIMVLLGEVGGIEEYEM
jgi:ATP citrate (pro-S)-lyase